ncbi:RNA polymerase sigma factor RpoH [Methylophilus sp. VKM B-3414]|uniref:RNA polymerase sigma factor RpoH n=1 Tax=unclassified Methylophilus TaxID=2630143 RepID=UPI00188DDDF3|nr:RNA polymerase sigma factor RpoH [Methylophilus sp. VKM B-3414]MBF5039329.1 RNA polymerase sigma factor RpoH [Methylophilus sp. 13]MDF0377495.1 RNA polymerase sigma factor RpoH [Methylophilus sp. YYY-1]MDT7849567.1 RNA polymerase sigma factor RpoH [Methylophilus sp. VKM B-3414]
MNAFTLPVVASADSLDKYLQTIKQFPVLTAEEEYGYATRLKQSGDLEAARALIVSHLRLVASIARGYSGYGLPQSDLIQEGNIGLMKAVKRFDPDRGVRLVSFAMHWIKAEIHEYIVRNWRLVKTATTKAQRKLFFNLRSMKNGFETLSQEDVQRIATELNVKPEDVTEMEYRLNGQEISLDAQVDEDGEEVYSPIAFLEDEGPEPSTLLENLQTEHMQTEGLSMALQQLDERSRRVLQARWLTEGNTATLHDLAAEFSVSAERIRQIEQKAMQKIKTYMLESK